MDRRWLAPLLLLALALSARAWLYGIVQVETASMAPGYPPGAALLYNKLATPTVGDVVVIELPDDPGTLHVKRLVAGGGQEVELHRGQLYVDGERRTGELEGAATWTDPDCAPRDAARAREGDAWILPGGEHERERIPVGAFWALGDQRGRSSDSRHWGPVAEESILGVIHSVLWYQEPCGGVSPGPK